VKIKGSSRLVLREKFGEHGVGSLRGWEWYNVVFIVVVDEAASDFLTGCHAWLWGKELQSRCKNLCHCWCMCYHNI